MIFTWLSMCKGLQGHKSPDTTDHLESQTKLIRISRPNPFQTAYAISYERCLGHSTLAMFFSLWQVYISRLYQIDDIKGNRFDKQLVWPHHYPFCKMFSVQMSCWHLVEQSWPFPSRLKQKFSACEIFPEPALLSFRRLLESPVCYTQVMPLCSINIKLMRLSQNILIEFLTNQCSHLCVSTKICARTNFIFICHCRLVPAFKTGDQAEDFR